ncbi:GNAT family protein [Pantoea sp. T14]|uniref:GNAT family N-acetyltransferase n=1 Tax=unclassified Pantoea TaxID=2630326 RepID=UPI001FA97BA2
MNINQYGQQIGWALPDWQPVAKPLRQAIVGNYCLLAPLDPEHSEALYQAFSLAEDDRDWTWLSTNKPNSVEELRFWVIDKVDNLELVPFTVVDKTTQRPVGVVCFANIEVDNGAIEIGHVTWSPLMQRNVIGTEALYLLLKTVFSLGYRRVAWRCDSTNLASRRAAERLGFTFEGRFRQTMTRKQRNRDTDWLSMIDSEWPRINQALSGWLAENNFDGEGQQKKKLVTFF